MQQKLPLAKSRDAKKSELRAPTHGDEKQEIKMSTKDQTKFSTHRKNENCSYLAV